MRLIDADAFLERMSHTDRFFGVVYDINDAPTVDAVAVVRCWDCKHGEPYKRTDGATGYYCHCKYNVFEYGDRRKYTPVRASDDYCSYGDRKETK